MTQSEKLFIKLAAASIGKDFVSQSDADGADTREILLLAKQHKLLPIIYTGLKKSGIKLFTDEEEKAVKKAVIAETAFQVSRNEALLRLYDKMSSENIYPCVVKGIVLAALYENRDMRISADTDLLIPADIYTKAERIMLDEGLKEKEDSGEDDTVRTYINERNGLYIEAHTLLFPEYPSLNRKMNLLFENAAERRIFHDIDGHKVASFSHTDHLLFLVLHSFKHFIYCGFGLRQIMDFILYAKTFKEDIDHKKIEKALDAVSAFGFFRGLLSVCKTYFFHSPTELGFDIPDSELPETDDMIADILSGGIYGGNTEERLHSSKMTLAAADKNKKVSFLSSLFPSADALSHQYTYLKKHKILLPAAWFSRIVRHMKKDRSSAGKFDPEESIEIGKERISMMRKYGIIK